MGYFKFNKKEAIEFCQKVNKGENIQITEENVTTGYCQPFEYLGSFYVIADDVTSKYTDQEPIDIYATRDVTPPTLSPYAVIIPEIYKWAFPEDKFILNGFEIPLDVHGLDKVVNLAYFMWQEFRDELDSGKYEDLKRALDPIWMYVKEQADTIVPWLTDSANNQLGDKVIIL
jgi:hypothetical protein